MNMNASIDNTGFDMDGTDGVSSGNARALSQSIPVYPAEAFQVVDGANIDDFLSFASEVELDDRPSANALPSNPARMAATRFPARPRPEPPAPASSPTAA
jgi:hypothetical protein